MPYELKSFSPTSAEEVANIIVKSKKSSCPFDPFPPKLYCPLLPSIIPHLTTIFNDSLSSGVVPLAFKTAAVRPLLKKPNLDPDSPSSYRPISLLPFLSKILERIVASRLIAHMSTCNTDESFQSGFKPYHSTESALLTVTNDLLRTSDAGDVSLLVLLDLSAAFDTIDHSVLITRLHSFLGLKDTALAWLKSYLSSRNQSVFMNSSQSDPFEILSGVPQGSVLGPLLFRIYLLPLGTILRQLNLRFHFYADDTQIYLSCSSSSFTEKINSFLLAYKTISQWISANFLKLNADKTEIMILGKPTVVARCKSELQSLKLDNTDVPFSNKVRNLGVTFDESLHFKDHISSVFKATFLQLRNLKHIRAHFNRQSFEVLVSAFITSRLDYCNSLLSGLPSSTLRPLSLIQNFAARLIFRQGKFSHVTPLLKELHWLPIPYRIDFKILMLTYKALHSLAPSYLTSLLSPRTCTRTFRSSHSSRPTFFR